MKKRRLYVSPGDCCGSEVLFPTKIAHYVTRVLRLRTGDRVEVHAGERQLLVQLHCAHNGEVRGEVLQSCLAEPGYGPHVTLAFGCVRPAPFQEILRHGTELGVSCFVPVISTRVTRRPEDKKERWDTIVASASAQCHRPVLPEVRPPVALSRYLTEVDRSSLRLILSCAKGCQPILEALSGRCWDSAIILAGPEGGFTHTEYEHAMERGFLPVTLGPSILRTETAAIVAVGALSLWYGCQIGFSAD